MNRTNDYNGEELRRLIVLVEGIDVRLGNLEATVDARLRETRPLWDQVLGQIDELRAGLERLGEGQGELRARLDESLAGQEELRAGQGQLQTGLEVLRAGQERLRADMVAGLHKVERQLGVLSKGYVEVRAELSGLEDRIEKLEGGSG